MTTQNKQATAAFEVRRAATIALPRSTYRIPALALKSGECGIIFGDSRSRATDVVRALGGDLPRDGFALPPEPGKIRQRLLSIDLSAIPAYLDDDHLYGDAVQERIGLITSIPDLNILGRTVIEDYLSALAAVSDSEPLEEQVAVLQLRQFKLSDKLHRATHVLSGGEKQRLNCATALAGERRLLVVDFAASSLDQRFRRLFLKLLGGHCTGGGIAIVTGLSTSDIRQLEGATVRTFTLDECEPNVWNLREGPPPPVAYRSSGGERTVLTGMMSRREVSDATVLEVVKLRRSNMTLPASFKVAGHEVVVMRGDNGVGKTTLAEMIVGRHSGRGRLGDCILSDGVRPVMATQFPDEMLLGSTVSAELPDSSLQALCGFHAEDESADPRGLPYGRKKLLCVAIALTLSRGLCVLDEPTVGMDLDEKKRFVRLLNAFKETAVLIMTHDLALTKLGRCFVLGG